MPVIALFATSYQRPRCRRRRDSYANAEERYFSRQAVTFNPKVALLYNSNLEKVNLRCELWKDRVYFFFHYSFPSQLQIGNESRAIKHVSHFKNDRKRVCSTENRLIYRITIIRLFEILKFHSLFRKFAREARWLKMATNCHFIFAFVTFLAKLSVKLLSRQKSYMRRRQNTFVSRQVVELYAWPAFSTISELDWKLKHI